VIRYILPNQQIFCRGITSPLLTKWLRGAGWNGFAGRTWSAGRRLATLG